LNEFCGYSFGDICVVNIQCAVCGDSMPEWGNVGGRLPDWMIDEHARSQGWESDTDDEGNIAVCPSCQRMGIHLAHFIELVGA